jgi:hypothetical protein
MGSEARERRVFLLNKKLNKALEIFYSLGFFVGSSGTLVRTQPPEKRTCEDFSVSPGFSFLACSESSDRAVAVGSASSAFLIIAISAAAGAAFPSFSLRRLCLMWLRCVRRHERQVFLPGSKLSASGFCFLHDLHSRDSSLGEGLKLNRSSGVQVQQELVEKSLVARLVRRDRGEQRSARGVVRVERASERVRVGGLHVAAVWKHHGTRARAPPSGMCGVYARFNV